LKIVLVSSLAIGGDIPESRTAKYIVAGSGIKFDDIGSHEPKVVPGNHQRFKVIAA